MVLKTVVWTNLCIIRNLFSFEKRQNTQSKSHSKKKNRIDNIDIIIMSVINSIISLKWL